MDKDPVCGMAVTRKDVSGESKYQGKSYFFCSPSCKEKFDAQPEHYAIQRLADDSRRTD